MNTSDLLAIKRFQSIYGCPKPGPTGARGPTGGTTYASGQIYMPASGGGGNAQIGYTSGSLSAIASFTSTVKMNIGAVGNIANLVILSTATVNGITPTPSALNTATSLMVLKLA